MNFKNTDVKQFVQEPVPGTPDAMIEAGRMMQTPMNQLPPLAMDYLKDLAGRIGICGEVYVTAYAAYCQAVLKMPCSDPLYVIPPSEQVWWDKHINDYV